MNRISVVSYRLDNCRNVSTLTRVSPITGKEWRSRDKGNIFNSLANSWVSGARISHRYYV